MFPANSRASPLLNRQVLFLESKEAVLQVNREALFLVDMCLVTVGTSRSRRQMIQLVLPLPELQ